MEALGYSAVCFRFSKIDQGNRFKIFIVQSNCDSLFKSVLDKRHASFNLSTCNAGV